MALVAILVIVGGSAWLYLRTSLPQISGTLRLAGVAAPITITRDARGIPYIKAASSDDAWFALGFLHAQDRLAQMELMRRSARGTLSEVLGRFTVTSDRFMRVFGVAQQVDDSLAELSPAARAQLDAYAAGVNAYLASDPTLPPEFLRLPKPAPWTPADSLLWGRLMMLQLAGNWRDELNRARLSHLAPEMLDELWPDRKADSATTLGSIQTAPTRAAEESPTPTIAGLDALFAALPAPAFPDRASNEFVVSGTRTRSGKPILSNDPHLSLNAPGQWYLARIEMPDLTLTGATAPGVPAMVLGHNGTIAWGFTTTHADMFDVFVERADSNDPTRYEAPGESRAFTTRTEIIKVRGGEDITLTVRSTRHGPVISDLSPETGDILALSHPGVYRPDRTAEALFAMGRARDWPQFLAALADWHAPMQNVVYADTEGNIGFIAPGLLPRRRPSAGPRIGWTGANDWDGFHGFAELPQTYNPASGRIVNSNNRIVPDDFPIYISPDWDSSFRAQRINERLDTIALLDATSGQSIVTDSLSLFARAVIERIGHVATRDSRSQQALMLLHEWDGTMLRDRPEPLILTAWMRALTVALHEAPGDPLVRNMVRERPELILRALEGRSVFCRDKDGGCAAIVTAALDTAIDQLTIRFGLDMTRWRWGDVHRAPFDHLLFARLPLINRLMDFRMETDGDFYTVNRGGTRAGDPVRPFAHVHGAGYRAVYDLANLDESLIVATPGQSGHPLSRHWGDMAALWASGGHFMLPARPNTATTTLMLVPQ